MKICISCNKKLELNAFSGNNSTKDKLCSSCKICVRAYSKQLRIKNGWVKKVKKEKVLNLKRNREQKKMRMDKDPIFKIKCNTRSLLYNSFKRACKGKYKKSLSTENMLCCSMDFFIKHIENLFSEGMTFENYGLWHLDHIKPISNCKTIEDIINYNHYTNLQPLWAKDNILKSNK